MLSHDSDEEESDKLGSESGSAGKYCTGLAGLLRGIGFTLGVTISANELCDGDGGSIALPLVNIGEACTGECMDNGITFSIARKNWLNHGLIRCFSTRL